MKRALGASIASNLLSDNPGEAPPFILALFQRRSYFDVEAARYGAFAAAGATVVVGFPGPTDRLPTGVVGVDVSAREEVSDAWVLVTITASLSSALVAVDGGGFVDDEDSFEASRSFVARWTFRHDEAVDACRQLVRPISPQLPPRVLALAESALRGAELSEPSDAEERLLGVLEVIGGALRLRQAPTNGDHHPVDGADRDLLTDLHNRRFLERYTASKSRESAATVAAVMLDVDDLGALNERRGPEAGDAALIAVAEVLKRERRPGDVLVRYADDEFLVLAAMSDDEGALEFAERLVAAVRSARLPAPFEDEHISVSAGATVADPVRIPFDHLEDGLHLAKLLGKNVARLID